MVKKRELWHGYRLLNSRTCDTRLILETHGDPSYSGNQMKISIFYPPNQDSDVWRKRFPIQLPEERKNLFPSNQTIG